MGVNKPCPNCTPNILCAACFESGKWLDSVDAFKYAIDQQAKNPPLYPGWKTYGGAMGGGKKFTMDTLKEVHDAIMKASDHSSWMHPAIVAEPPAPRGAYHIGFMSAEDVAEVRRLIGVRP